MAFVFDDQALIDLANEPAQAGNLDYLRHPRGLTHLLNLASIRVHGVESAWPWHAENLALHLMNVCLVGSLWGRWAALFYLVHPISGGLSVYVSARADLLMIFFAVASVVTWEAGGAWAVLAPACVYCSRGAKHVGPIAALFVFLVRWVLP